MAIQLKDTKFGDTIVTKTNGTYSFDATVDTTNGFSVTSSSGQMFSVNNNGDIAGNSLTVAGELSSCGLHADSGGVSASQLDVGCGAFKVNSCGEVSTRNELLIADENGTPMSHVGNGGMSLMQSTGSGTRQVFKVDSSCGLSLYNDTNGGIVLNAGDGYLNVCGYASSGMKSVFAVGGCGLDFYNGSGEMAFRAEDGRISVSGYNYNANRMQSVFDASTCGGLIFYNYSGYAAFNVGDGSLFVSGYSYATNSMQTVFGVDTCGGLNLYNSTGDAVFTVTGGSLSVSGYSSLTSGMTSVLDVNTCGGLTVCNDHGQVFRAGDGSISASGYNSNAKAMNPVFDASINGVKLYNSNGDQVVGAGDGWLSINSSSNGGMQPVFTANSCGLSLHDSRGGIVLNAGDGNLDVCGFDSFSSGYYSRFSVDSCGIFVNIGNASGHLTTVSVQGSGGSSVTVLTLV